MSILDFDIGMVLFKEPTVEIHTTPEAPHTVVPVEKNVSAFEGTVLAFINSVFLFPVFQYVIHV